jgi:hypothetical protein
LLLSPFIDADDDDDGEEERVRRWSWAEPKRVWFRGDDEWHRAVARTTTNNGRSGRRGPLMALLSHCSVTTNYSVVVVYELIYLL